MNYYIVDTNIIISYINNESTTITNFINNKMNKFFYTETVKNELEIKNKIIPDIFIYHNSEISENKKELAYNELTTNAILIPLTDIQKENFKNDIKIIFEASYIAFDSDILPLDETDSIVYFLTNNLKLYKRFICNPINRKKLETVINLYGFEHLIPVVSPKDVIIGL